MSESTTMLLWMGGGLVAFVVGVMLPLRWMRTRRVRQLSDSLQSVGDALGFQAGATRWGLLGGFGGTLEGCRVFVECTLSPGLPRLTVRHPRLPDFALDKGALRAGLPWVAALDDDARQTLEQWQRVPGFRAFDGALVVELDPRFSQIPGDARAMAHLMAEIARVS